MQLDDKSQSDILDLGGDGMIDIKAGVWQSRGWKELKPLSLKLQSLPQLRKLVRELGRGGGMGPLRRAPRQEVSRVCFMPTQEDGKVIARIVEPVGCVVADRFGLDRRSALQCRSSLRLTREE